MTGAPAGPRAFFLWLALASFPAQASDYMDEARRIYARHHPAQAPIIKAGEDLPICPAARESARYDREKLTNVRYLLHGYDGWIFSTRDFRTDFAALPPALEYFDRLNAVLWERGQKLVVVFTPPRGALAFSHADPADVPEGYSPARALKNYAAFLAGLERRGITAVGVPQALQDGADYFRSSDIHWSLDGARHTAARVAKAVTRLPAFSGIPKRDFETEPAGQIEPSTGGYTEALGRLCGTKTAPRPEQIWTTTMTAGLLDEVEFPSMTALGTSYTAYDDRFDFVGSLRRLLHADIHNAAVTGGGFGESASVYFSSDSYHARPPKIILWEFAYFHNYNKRESLDAFRQMIPAVYGACDRKDALAVWSGDIAAETTAFLDAALHRPLKDSYLYFDMTDPAARSVNIQILYADGSADDIDMTRSTRTENNGKYYLELGRETPAPALFFRLVTDMPRGRLEARLCPYPDKAGKR